MSEQPQNENENENVRDIRIHVRPGFTRRPGTLRLRQKFFRLSAQAAELEELAAQNDKKAQKEALKLFVKYDMLLEHVLRIGCRAERLMKLWTISLPMKPTNCSVRFSESAGAAIFSGAIRMGLRQKHPDNGPGMGYTPLGGRKGAVALLV